jgi:glycosyltransferase involved in cell wall biosynthesis
MQRSRYWEIAWDIHPQGANVQVLPRTTDQVRPELASAEIVFEDAELPVKILQLLSRERPLAPGRKAALSAPGAFPKTVHGIGSLGAGGAERQLVNLLVDLHVRGHNDQALLTLYPLEGAAGHYAPLLAEHSIRHIVNNQPIRPEAYDLIRSNFEIVQAIKALPPSFNAWVLDLWVDLSIEKPDVAHMWLDHLNIWGGLAAVLAGVPLVVLSGRNVHPGNFPYLHMPYMLPAYRMLMGCAGVKMLNNSSPGGQSYAEWIGIAPASVDVILNGVNLDHLQPATPQERSDIRAGIGIPQDAVVVAGAFRLSEEKRPELFVETFAAARAAHPDIHAVLMGEGPYLAQVQEKVRELGLEGCFHALGRRTDLPKVMTSMDVFLHTAFWEGTPNVVLEAQQLQMPIVVTDAGGTFDAAHDGVTGYRVPKEDTAQLSARLIDVIGDLAAWRERAKAGPAFVRDRFSVERMVRSTLESQVRALRTVPEGVSGPPVRRGLAGWWDRLVR